MATGFDQFAMREVEHPRGQGNPDCGDDPENQNGFAKKELENGEERKDADGFGIDHIPQVDITISQRIGDDQIRGFIMIHHGRKEGKEPHHRGEHC